VMDCLTSQSWDLLESFENDWLINDACFELVNLRYFCVYLWDWWLIDWLIDQIFESSGDEVGIVVIGTDPRFRLMIFGRFICRKSTNFNVDVWEQIRKILILFFDGGSLD
jgi:hypothetical protein